MLSMPYLPYSLAVTVTCIVMFCTVHNLFLFSFDSFSVTLWYFFTFFRNLRVSYHRMNDFAVLLVKLSLSFGACVNADTTPSHTSAPHPSPQ